MKLGEAYWNVVKKIWDTISIYDGEIIFLEQFAKTDLKEKNLFAAHWCQSEIRNGGFYQFFDNSTGILAPEAVDAFRAIGMPKTANLIKKAMGLFGSTYPRDKDKRGEALRIFENQSDQEKDLFDEIDKFDKEFFVLIRKENDGFEIAADNYALSGE